jgi:hypothetical protein
VNDARLNQGHTVRFYDGQIPPFAEAALEARYGALYSALPQLSLTIRDGISTYTDSAHGKWRALFLFVCEGCALRVINEGMDLDASDAERFAQQVFARDARIRQICFRAIRVTGRINKRPSLRMSVTEDIVIDLPTDEAAYVASLGKSTRKTLRQNLLRANNLCHTIVPGAACDASLIDSIIGFNHARMAGKQRASALDAKSSAQLLALVRARGVAGTIRMDGMLRAGTLACRFGDDVYSLVNAHDPAVDHLGMGNLSRHLMILAAIRSGARRFHLLGGHFASKRSCGATRMALDDLTIYRNSVAMMMDMAGIIAMARRSALERLRIATEAYGTTRPGNQVARFMAGGVRLARELTRAWRRMTAARR